jgi:hypothetical protein
VEEIEPRRWGHKRAISTSADECSCDFPRIFTLMITCP